MTFVISSGASPAAIKISDGFINVLPGKMDFSDGKLTIDKPYPYIIRFSDFMTPEMIKEAEAEAAEKGEKVDFSVPFIIFQEKVTPEEAEKYEEIVLIGQDRTISKSNGKIEIHPFDKYKNRVTNETFSVTHEKLFSWRDKAMKFFPLLLAFIMIPMTWVAYLVKAFFIALASHLVTLAVKVPLEFGDRYRIAVFSYAPVFMIREIAQVTAGFGIGFLATFLASLLYFSVILTAAKKYGTPEKV